jgi:hypothetical protein
MSTVPGKDLAIDAIFADLPAELGTIAGELRRTIHAVAPRLQECVKWNAPHWMGRKLVLNFMVYPDHLSLGVWRGAELADSFRILEGTGKSLRHVKVKSVAQARSAEIRKIIEAACTLDAR